MVVNAECIGCVYVWRGYHKRAFDGELSVINTECSCEVCAVDLTEGLQWRVMSYKCQVQW